MPWHAGGRRPPATSRPAACSSCRSSGATDAGGPPPPLHRPRSRCAAHLPGGVAGHGQPPGTPVPVGGLRAPPIRVSLPRRWRPSSCLRTSTRRSGWHRRFSHWWTTCAFTPQAPIAADPADAAFALSATVADLPPLSAFGQGQPSHPRPPAPSSWVSPTSLPGSHAVLSGPGIASASSIAPAGFTLHAGPRSSPTTPASRSVSTCCCAQATGSSGCPVPPPSSVRSTDVRRHQRRGSGHRQRAPAHGRRRILREGSGPASRSSRSSINCGCRCPG